MLRLLLAALATGLFTSSGAAQVAYPPRPETFDLHLRYRIRADRDDRIRQFRTMQGHLKALGFVEAPREDADLDVFDTTAEDLRGTLPSAQLDRLFDNPSIVTAVVTPAGQAVADGAAPVAVRIRIASGFAREAQQNLHGQVVGQLGLLGFRESVSYDTAGDTLVRGVMPSANVGKLTKDLRTLPSGWFLPAVPPDQLPAPLRTTLPIRTVEVLATPVAAAVAPVAEAAPAPGVPLLSPKLTPDAKALLNDAANAGNSQRFDLILTDPPGDDWPTLRERLRTSAEGVSVEGLVGVVVSVRVARAADIARLADVLEVRAVRLPKVGSLTGGPAKSVATAVTVPQLLQRSGVERLHQRGYRGAGQRVVLIGTDFAGLTAAKSSPAVELLDLTAELNPDLVPNPTATGVGAGTLAARVVTAAAPESRVTAVRIDPAAFHQLYGLATLVSGDAAYSQSMQTRAFELTRRADTLVARRVAVLGEYAKAFADLGDEDRTVARRDAARKALDQLTSDEQLYQDANARFTRLKSQLDGLRGSSVVVNTLVWDTGYPQDGLNELSRLIDARYTPAPQRSALRTLKGPPAPVWVQAAGVNAGRVWSGPFLDADGDGVMEFAPDATAVPAGRWTRELNFLEAKSPDGTATEVLPAGTKLRVTVQWREPQDPGGFTPREPVLPLTVRLLRQLDPTGKTAASDDLEVVAQSSGEPVKLLRTAASGAFEQTLDVTLPVAGVYALRLDGRSAFDYQLPALRQGIEVSPRIVVERVGPDTNHGAIGFRTFPTLRSGVGLPGDSLTALTVGTSDGRTQLGTGPGVGLGVKPDLVAPGGLTVGDGTHTGSTASAAFVGGAAASLASAGVRATDLTRLFGLTPGGEFVLPDEWLRSLSPSRREH